LQGRCIEVLGEQAPEVTGSYPKPIGQRFDIASIKCTAFDERESALDSRLGALPRRTERSCFWTAAQARSKTRVFCGSRTAIKVHIP
jgi:hypothetical protein